MGTKYLKWAIILIALLGIAACGDPVDNNPNPNGDDDNVTDGGCTNCTDGDAGDSDTGDDTGTDGGDPCVKCDGPNEKCLQGVCVCKEGFEGPNCTPTDPCKDLVIDSADWLASKAFEAGATGMVTVDLPANDPDVTLNGTYLKVIAANTWLVPVTIVMAKATGVDVPAGYFSIDVTGIEVKALDSAQPYIQREDGTCDFNEVPLNAEVVADPANRPELFINRYGTVLFHDGTDWVYPSVENGFTYELVPKGAKVRVAHFSPYYILDSAPTLSVVATPNPDNTVDFDFEGTLDEGSNASFLFTFTLEEDGTPVEVVYAGDAENPYLYKTVSSLSAGMHNLTAIVTGKNFNSTTHPQDKAEKALEMKIETPDLCEGIDCGAHGNCVNGTCNCTEGYAGDRCQNCANGYHADGQNCVINSTCEVNSCNSHGNCSDTTGVIVCSCNTEYMGPTCAQCASGYQDKDGDKTCLPDCNTSALQCQSNASCSDSSGTATCICNANFQDNDHNGTCLEACDSGYCNGHGSCSDATGTRVCSCDTGWAQPTCNSCASGYLGTDCHRDWCGLNTCQNGGTCSNEQCSCVGGYSGAHCEVAPDPCAGVNCNGHGTCSGGACGCDTGFDPATNCGSCASGYWDFPVCHINHAPVVSVQASPNPVGIFDVTTISLTASDSDGDNLPWELTLTNPNGGSLSNPSSGTCDTATHCSGTCIGGNCTGINKITVTFNTGDTTNATTTVTANDGRGGTDSEGPYWIGVE